MTQAPEDSQWLFGYSSCSVDRSGAVCHLRRSVNETILGPVRWPDQHGRTRVDGDREFSPSGESALRLGLRACDHVRMVRARSSPHRRSALAALPGCAVLRGCGESSATYPVAALVLGLGTSRKWLTPAGSKSPWSTAGSRSNPLGQVTVRLSGSTRT